jgi:hypothetical protein
MAVNEAATRRLRAYCARAVYSRSEVADNGLGRDVRVVNKDLRTIIWRDSEVRSVLLKAGDDRNAWDALLGQVDDEAAAVGSRVGDEPRSSDGRREGLRTGKPGCRGGRPPRRQRLASRSAWIGSLKTALVVKQRSAR